MVQETLGNQFDPPKIREMLRPGLEQAGFTVGQYNYKRDDILEQLIADEAVIYPDYLKLASHEDKWREIVTIAEGLETDQRLIIPLSLGIVPFMEGRRLQKRGPLVTIRRYANQDAPVSSVDAFRDAASREKLGDLRSGYDVDGSNWADRRLRAFTLYDLMRATVVDTQLPDVVDVLSYTDTDDVFEKGAQVVTRNVPSLSGGNGYQVVLNHVPVFQGEEITPKAIEASYAFHDPHQCDRKDWYEVVYRRERSESEEQSRNTPETLLDHHTMIAYRQARRELLRQNPGWRIPNLFPDATEDKVEFFMKTIRQVAFESPRGISLDDAPNVVVLPEQMKIETEMVPIGNYNMFVEAMLHNRVARDNELSNVA